MEKPESELIEEYKNGSQVAVNELFAKNEKLIAFVFDRHFKTSGCPMEDMLQEGCIGLFEAIKRFDCKKEAQFNSYKVIWIKKKMYDFRKKYFKGPTTVLLESDHFQLPAEKSGEEKMKYALFELDNLVECGKLTSKDANRLIKKIIKGTK